MTDSLAYLVEFSARIERVHASGNKADEAFIRGVMSEWTKTCPVDLLLELAECVLAECVRNYRAAELREQSGNN